ncbi:PHP domain-containing protein [Fusibacter ferrireducens]|uniref:PHP domain-containing protein n=1 Tax=Fusibacter ferrireducens TaxID=2785058 RepID=A0ABR9ZQ20_9FIRM|nr:PHP domain-containing protein [Fusibacter ferrireducens]MBF4692514.1 PHP domain-containing protein [Fusibacter ferrireducens]
MIIDLHFHTKQYSSCSRIDMEEGIEQAKAMGLEGVCITDHDVFACREKAQRLQEKYGILVIVGTEIYTKEGDLLCFGLDEIPSNQPFAQDLIDHINQVRGACIAAHPFRNNNRGMGETLRQLKGIHAIESLNGNTSKANNERAKQMAHALGVPCTGGSDAHSLDRIGSYATRFLENIKNESDLICAIRRGQVMPWGKC